MKLFPLQCHGCKQRWATRGIKFHPSENVETYYFSRMVKLENFEFIFGIKGPEIARGSVDI